jgi:peptide subunit release factor 1 (eRF1)
MTVVTPTFKDVQWLADRPGGEGLVVSCYADTSVSSGTRPLWREHLKNEVKRLEATLTGGAAARSAFRRNIAAVTAVLASRRPPGARGMAVFAALERGFVAGYALAVPVVNRLVADEEPYLMPLLEILSRQRQYLVVHTDTSHGRLYSGAPGVVRLLEEIDGDVPRRQRASGQRWGTRQATIERHRDERILHYLKELVGEIERAWREERYDGLVLLGDAEVLERVRDLLPDRLARQLVHEAPRSWTGRQPSLESAVAAIHAESLLADDRRIVEEVNRRILENHHVTAGTQEVIDALRNGQVGFPGRVVMEPDRGDPAWRCTGCKSLFNHTVGECPFCRARCEKTNLWQAIALLAIEHDIPAQVVAGGLGLERHGGVVALLAREEPWAASEPALRPSLSASRV